MPKFCGKDKTAKWNKICFLILKSVNIIVIYHSWQFLIISNLIILDISETNKNYSTETYALEEGSGEKRIADPAKEQNHPVKQPNLGNNWPDN